MPDAGDNERFLMLEKNYFYALSWVISETGKLKDEGLQFFAVAEALQQTEGINHEEALHRSFDILGLPTDRIEKILNQASEFIARYMREANLEKLVYGVERVVPG